MKSRRSTLQFAGWCVLAGWLLLAPLSALSVEPTKEHEPAKELRSEKSATCELILEGKHIDELRLGIGQSRDMILLVRPGSLGRRSLGHQQLGGGDDETKLIEAGSSTFLPPRRYQILDVQVEGKYGTRRRSNDSERWLILSPQRPCQPDIGAPLVPTASVKRMGRLLKLGYQLFDGGGREYFLGQVRGTPPSFAIYQGDRQIGSGSFKYG